MPPARPAPRLYFAYGANLAFRQMATRCPGSSYVGRAVLPDYRWQINERGYANILPAPGSCVHGLAYELDADPTSLSSDEARLDRSEGVHVGAYIKGTCAVLLYPARRTVRTSRAAVAAELVRGGGAVNVGWVGSGRDDEGVLRVEDGVLVYLSHVFVRPGRPRDEYVDRMNEGIRDAVAMGVPAAYFANAVREWVPERAQAASLSVRRPPRAGEELVSRREELVRRGEELMGRQPSRSRSLSGTGRRWTSEDVIEMILSERAQEEQSRTLPPAPPDAATPRGESPSQGDEQPDNESVDSFSVADFDILLPVIMRPQFTAAIHTLLDRSEFPLQTALRVPLLGDGHYDDDSLGTVEVTMLPCDCVDAIRRRFYGEDVIVRLGPSTRFAFLPDRERPAREEIPTA